ncbi:hypothetical protein KIL84_018994 [Mauremys mutica]|uniref:Phospholipase A1 member A n=1 Tax=Mauremys mutica TaxID=74926 RepID=A0A9D3XVY0_9SAUR|nr:hypothetical protein KIL84_018994 [Mauremys mutica]
MGRLIRKKAEDPRKKLLFVLAAVLLLSSACAGQEAYIPVQPCSDFQTASFLQSTKLKVQFLLFTSSNPSCGQLISLGDDIKNSNFNTSLDTKIIIHGFRALGTKPSWINGLMGALFRAAKVNVVAVDWVYGATRTYPGAVENVMKLSIEISHFINKLLPTASLHPAFIINARERDFGIRIPVGHIDYFINGGKDQPGCPRFISLGYNYLICDHMRAVHLYVNALENSCPMMAFPCSSHENFLAGHCLDCSKPFLLSCPRIGLLERGGVSVAKLPEEVKVYLVTASSAPYCMYHSLVEFHLQQKRSLVTNLEITFRSTNSTASVKITIPKQQQLGKGVLAHPVPLCQIDAVTLKYLPKSQIWKKDKAVIVGNFCTTALPVSNREKMFCLSQSLSLTASRPFEHDLAVACA